MGQNNKKYLDYAGLEKLVDLHAIVPHPQVEITEEGAYKIAFDEHGHITSKSPLTAGDLGLDKAMHFVGVSTTDPVSSTGATVAGHTGSFVAGDVCIYKRGSETGYEEYVYTGAAWELLGDADSYALKSIKVEGDGTYVTGGGDLSQNRKLSHKTYTAIDPVIKAIGRDAGGHVVVGDEIIVQQDGGFKHSHTTSTTIAKDTYVTSVSPNKTKLSISPTKSSVVTSVPSTTSRLNTTTITPVSGSVTASKATSGTAIAVAKAGTAVRYGTANIGTEVTGLAKRATSQTTVGNANINSQPTTVGDANVGEAVVYGKANVGTAITVQDGKADVGSAVVYGKANVGSEVEVAVKASAASTFLTSVSASAPTTSVSPSKTVYNASVSGETLVFDAVTFSATTTAPTLTPTTGDIIGVGSTTKITPAVAAPSTQTLTPAVASNRTKSIAPAVAAPDTQTLTPAVASATSIYGVTESTTKIYGVTSDQVSIIPAVAAPSTQTIVPAVSNGSITPWTFTDVTVPKAAESVTVATGGVSTGGSGTAVVTSIGDIETVEALTAASITAGTSGDVEVANGVTVNKNAAATFSGTTNEHTQADHTHTLATNN